MQLNNFMHQITFKNLLKRFFLNQNQQNEGMDKK